MLPVPPLGLNPTSWDTPSQDHGVPLGLPKISAPKAAQGNKFHRMPNSDITFLPKHLLLVTLILFPLIPEIFNTFAPKSTLWFFLSVALWRSGHIPSAWLAVARSRRQEVIKIIIHCYTGRVTGRFHLTRVYPVPTMGQTSDKETVYNTMSST